MVESNDHDTNSNTNTNSDVNKYNIIINLYW